MNKKTLAKIVETKFVGNKTYLRSSIVAQLVEALHYKLEGRGFDSRWYHWNFSLIQSFCSHYDPGYWNIS
jgi:hypothetical protein